MTTKLINKAASIFMSTLLLLVFGCAISLFEKEIEAQAQSVDTSNNKGVNSAEVADKKISQPVKEAPKEDPANKGSEEVSAPGNVTMDFKDADINNVLRILSFKSGMNIVAGKDVEGLVTIRLTDVPWEKALEVVLKTYGYSYEKDGNIIRVTSIKSMAQEELSTEAFTLNYSKAKEVSDSIKDMISERGKVRFDERTNVLIVTDVPSNLYKISQIVKRLDKKIPQVMIEARIIETELGSDENLGINWSVKVSASGSSRPTTFPFDTMKAPFGDAQTLRAFFPRSQSTTTTSQAPSGGAAANTTLFTSTDFPVAQEPVFPFAQASNFTFGTLDFTQFSAVLELLKQRRNTNILSNPKIATLNNKPASILVGSILSVPTFERNADTGTIELTGYKDRNIGIQLEVVPNINEEKDIIVELKPQISDLLGFDVLDQARGITAPRFATREAHTQVMVQTGQTIMIGGLIKENNIDYKKKVPFLGDVPGINWLFTKIEKNKVKTELIFFVTVNIIDNSSATVPSSAYVPMKVSDKLPITSTLESKPEEKPVKAKKVTPKKNAQVSKAK